MELAPPYKIQTMKEINELKCNGFTVASLFSGAGGSSLGYRMAGYKVVYANEFIEAARNTYKENSKDTFLDDRDIRLVTGIDILRSANIKELDILDGSPPCSSFSMSGSREDGWNKIKKYSDTKQRTDDLFFEYIRLVKEIKPKIFIAENVAGLVLGLAKGYFLNIYEQLTALGYTVEAKILDAKWLGVPQSRRRVLIVGIRNDLNLSPVFPKPLKYFYSIESALVNVAKPEDDSSFNKYAIYNEWRLLSPGKSSNKYFQLVRPNPKMPSPTITATSGNIGAASVCHFNEPRKFSIPELKRLFSFPDDFIFTGSYTEKAERLGRSVPPLMMASLAKVIEQEVLKKINTKTRRKT